MIVESIILEYLRECLPVPVYAESPINKPPEYVIIEKVGGGEDVATYPRLAIQSYSTSLAGAAKLNETVKAAINSMIILDEIADCSLNSDYNYTNTETKQYRYQAVYDLVFF